MLVCIRASVVSFRQLSTLYKILTSRHSARQGAVEFLQFVLSDVNRFDFAVLGNCQRFVTLDRDFLKRRSLLEERCPAIRIVKPTELAEEPRAESGDLTHGFLLAIKSRTRWRSRCRPLIVSFCTSCPIPSLAIPSCCPMAT